MLIHIACFRDTTPDNCVKQESSLIVESKKGYLPIASWAIRKNSRGKVEVIQLLLKVFLLMPDALDIKQSTCLSSAYATRLV
jgi:hypothetical protein